MIKAIDRKIKGIIKAIILMSMIMFSCIILNNNSISNVVASETIPSNYTGFYIGKITSVNDFLLNDYSWIAEIDNVRYSSTLVTDATNASQNEVWKACREIGADNEAKSSTVVCEFADGYIKKIASISDIIELSSSIEKNEGSITYSQSQYSGEKSFDVRITTNMKSTSVFSEAELKSAAGKSKIDISADFNIPAISLIQFKNPKQVSNDLLEEWSSDFVGTKDISFEIVGNNDRIPSQITNLVAVTCDLKIEGYQYPESDNDIRIIIGNLDKQAERATQKSSNSTVKKAAKTAKSSLNNKVGVALDSNLSEFFSASQISEMEEFLTIWLAEIVESQTFEAQDTESQIQEKIRKEILGKLGVSIDTKLFIKDTSANVIIEADTEKYGTLKTRFDINIQNYTMDSSSNPFGSFGSLDYEVLSNNKIKNMQRKGKGVLTYVNIEAFSSQVKSIADSAIKGVYDAWWGNNANNAAKIFISKPVMEILGGDFSGKFYKLLTAPTEKYIRKTSVHCPVDIYIYDSDGNCCGSVINNEISSEYDDIYITVEGDDKYFYLTNEDYSVRFVGNGTGKMEYDVDIYDEGKLVRSFAQKNISLSKGIEYYAVFPANSLDKSMYCLTSEDGKKLNFDTDSGAWNGTASDSFAGGTGTSTDPYQISNESELKRLTNLVKGGNSFSGECFVLTNDIDLDYQHWTGIGTKSSPFSGIFDGNGHIIFNLCVIENNALFGYVSNGKIIDLNIQSNKRYPLSLSSENGKFVTGTLVYQAINGTEINECSFDGYLDDTAGIADYLSSDSVVSNCKNYGVPYGTGSRDNSSAGIVRKSEGTIQNCVNYGAIRGAENAGGIVYSASGTIKNCVNYGIIEDPQYEADNGCLGGIVGLGSNITVEDCINYGNIIGHSNYSTDGIIGNYDTWSTNYSSNNVISNNNENKGKVKLMDQVSDHFGSNITYSIDEYGVMTLAGSGTIGAFSDDESSASWDDYPWYSKYSGCIRKIIISEGITGIGDCAFYTLGQNQKEIELPDGLTRIGRRAFEGAIRVEELTLPDSVEQIDNGAFNSLIRLKEITLPEKLTTLGSSAFTNCQSCSIVTVLNPALDIRSAFDMKYVKELHAYEDSVLGKVYGDGHYLTFVSLGHSGWKDGEIKVTSIELDVDEATINIGDKKQLSVTILPENATNKNIIWRSDSTEIATIDEKGIVTGISDGVAVISARTTDESRKSAYCIIKVGNGGGDIEVVSIELNKDILEMGIGDTEQLKINISPSFATNKNVEWISDNENVATVDNNGVVKAVNYGMATIVVKTLDGSEIEEECYVEVADDENILIKSISFKTESVSVVEGTTEQLEVDILPENATDTELNWVSSDDAIATVDENGLVSAISVGTVQITAEAIDGSDVSATCILKVTKSDAENTGVFVSSIKLNKKTLKLKEGNEQTLVATVLPNTATNKKVLWSSDDTDVADVDEDGTVSAIQEGTATVTAMSDENNEIYAECVVTVVKEGDDTDLENIMVESVSLDINSIELKAGEKRQLVATISPDDATNQEISWESDDDSIAEVDSDGLVTAIAEGNTTITVVAQDGSDEEDTCTVTVLASESENTDDNENSGGNTSNNSSTTEGNQTTNISTSVPSSDRSNSSSSSYTSSTSSSSGSSSGGGGGGSDSSSTTYSAGSGSSSAEYSKSGKGNVKYEMSSTSYSAESAKVPATVKINGKTFNVTVIASEAFYGYDKLKTLAIGKNIKKIGKSAFSGCTKLKTITINSRKLTAKSVRGAFKGSAIKTVIVPADKVEDYKKIFTKKNTGSSSEITVKAKKK